MYKRSRRIDNVRSVADETTRRRGGEAAPGNAPVAVAPPLFRPRRAEGVGLQRLAFSSSAEVARPRINMSKHRLKRESFSADPHCDSVHDHRTVNGPRAERDRTVNGITVWIEP
ncbi:hypothetical protein EVAR_43771_1 [Eumeta japonica]|uniref:Uncharacterized protein n=1 Tax=Eumeta variegata TaxID=151549 RepID=A0A4C1XIM6_EUMVA|nr:hypothetical protein EVAR_43771_1 [Eumeta japonica]